ncbi:MAG: NAD(P)H-dependent oxidoreductase subunit E, partial [Burkholderiaceae bacterium]|nr:NAD(P)H-dependent oxidoreductase subunit E [Burkholderiaceae bacterium]
MSEKDVIDKLLADNKNDGTRLMQVLRQVQEALGWLSPTTLTHIAKVVGWPRAKVEGTADFYSFFHTHPLGRYRVLWSDNITDRMLGSIDLMESMCQKLWLEPGRVSEDGLVSVDTTSCTGMCDQGPAVLVNYRAITRMSPARVDEMVALIRGETPVTEWPADWFAVEDSIRRKDILLDHGLLAGQALSAALALGPEKMLAEIEASGLRGRGGAGFSTFQKWAACRSAEGRGDDPAHYVVCNADEGEPGTFKDRVLLTSYTDLVFEGISIAGLVVGAKKGLIYLRGEYRYLLEPLNSALAARRAAGLLGPDILGSGFEFDIEIHLGAGAYICGEESALIESLEGKPGRPRTRPPFPVTHGYLDQPTTVNNVETLAAACPIARHGDAWYAQHGTEKSTGSKILSVSGDCARPGIYEYS